MDSEDSHDGNSDEKSSSSRSSSTSRSRRSNSSDGSGSRKTSKSPKRSPSSKKSQSPHSPASEKGSKSPGQSRKNLNESKSDVNSPQSSNPGSPPGSPEKSKSSSPIRKNDSFAPHSPASGHKTPDSSSKSRSISRDSSPPSPKTLPISRDSSPPSPKTRPISRDSSPPSPKTRPKSPEPESPRSKSRSWRSRSRSRSYGKRNKSSSGRSNSESSSSSQDSSYNKRGNAKDTATEAISDGEMESDQEDSKSQTKLHDEKQNKKDTQLNISHEDLSDVSDLDSIGNDDLDKDSKSKSPSESIKEDIKVNGAKLSPTADLDKSIDNKKVVQEKTSNTEDGEEQLDFEAEEGECIEPVTKPQPNGNQTDVITRKEIEPCRRSRGSSLEEGEVSDDGDRRPEENEPRPLCRFYSRGACTWGISCRFLHPGVTDKGNYNMFDLVRGVPHPTPYPRPEPAASAPAPPESAWERGLRTAKEMLRIANKRKEQDMDFEEKKLHLSVGGAVHDPDAELAYAAAAVGASPPKPHEADPYSRSSYGPPVYRGRFPPGPGRVPDERERFYERERFERGERVERPYERPFYEERVPQYEEQAAQGDEAGYHKRRVRTSREVIVQRASPPPRPRESGRGDRTGEEWADPWMRGEPTARNRKREKSRDSYSSSSSHSSRSARRKKRRASSSSRQRRVSPAAIVRERRLATARATAMNPPAPRRRAPSPAAARQHAANPPPPTRHKEEPTQYGRRKPDRGKRYSRSTSSGSDSSSSSSGSDSASRSSSTSGSSQTARRSRHARVLNARSRLTAKSNAELAAAVSTATTNKKEIFDTEAAKRKNINLSPPNDNSAKSVSRREELLKQLKAVEDAIARKRSKI